MLGESWMLGVGCVVSDVKIEKRSVRCAVLTLQRTRKGISTVHYWVSCSV